jgi:hypothetical protein
MNKTPLQLSTRYDEAMSVRQVLPKTIFNETFKWNGHGEV